MTSLSITVMTLNLHEGEQPSESPNNWEKRRDICVSVSDIFVLNITWEIPSAAPTFAQTGNPTVGGQPGHCQRYQLS